METSEVSVHQAKLYMVARKNPSRWFTTRELAEASGIAIRTASMHASRLVKLGVLEVRELFPGHRFRLAQTATKGAKPHATRLDEAVEIFGLNENP
jgi:DNA-binding transcriptional ArsR family regulator